MLFQKVFIPLQSEYKMMQIIAVCFRFGAIVPKPCARLIQPRLGKKAYTFQETLDSKI